MIYLDLFIGFLKVGLFSFGGAYAAIPLIRDVVLSYQWLDDSMLSYMIAVSESTPGPIMINTATYIGATMGGFFGSLIATFAVVLPAFLIILLVTAVFSKVMKNRYVNATIDGIKPCIIGIILSVGVWMIFENIFGSVAAISPDLRALILTVVLGLIYFGIRLFRKKGISPILLIGIAAVLGMVVYI